MPCARKRRLPRGTVCPGGEAALVSPSGDGQAVGGKAPYTPYAITCSCSDTGLSPR